MVVLVLMCLATLLVLGLLGLGGGAALVRASSGRVGAVGAIVGGMVAIGAAGMLTVAATYIDSRLGVAVALALPVIAVATVVWSKGWIWWRWWAPLSLASGGVVVATLGLFGVWAIDRDPFEIAMTRTVGWTLPVDAAIPSMLATWFAEDGERAPLLEGDWLPGDRPPLQAGLLLMMRALLAPLTPLLSAADAERGVDFAASVGVQLCWVAGVVALLWSLGYGARTTVATIAFVGAVPTTYINTVFTWPKLLAGGFAVAGVGVLIAALREREGRVAAVVLASAASAFALLAHGAAAFVIPLSVSLAVFTLVRMPTRRALWTATAAVGAAAAVYLPWMFFQRIVSPPGDRLLKWHLAGVVRVDDRSLLTALVDQYASTPLDELVGARLSNLTTAFRLDLFAGWDVWNPGWLDRMQHAQFFSTTAALGIGSVLLIAMLVRAALDRRLWKRDEALRDGVKVVGATVACMLLWALLLFSPEAATVHQGSQAWMLIFAAVPFAWLAGRHPKTLLGVILPVQGVLTLASFWPTAHYAEAPWRISGIALLAVGIAAVVVAIVSAQTTGAPMAAVRFGTPTAYTRSSGTPSPGPDR